MLDKLLPITNKELKAVKPELFAPVLRNLIHIIGIEEAYQLTQQYGGISIWIPKNKKLGSNIFQKVSVKTAIKLIEKNPNKKLEVPKVDRILIQIRNNRIRRDKKEGYPNPTLAHMYNLTRRSIINICKKQKIEQERLKDC